MWKRLFLALVSLYLFLPFAAFSEPGANEAPRVVNLTTDSAAGWIPSVDDERQALEAFSAYYAHVDAGRFADAYQLLAPINQAGTPASDFEALRARFRSQAGTVVERRLRKVTWTKDSPRAPMPGIYAALDISSRYANIDLHCSYVILFRSPEGGGFRIMREESSFIDNASARGLSREQLAAAWAQISASCPNMN